LKRWRRSVLALLLPLLTTLALITPGTAQEGAVAVIVNPRNSITDVSSSDLRKIFNGEKRSWPAGVRIKLIVLAPGSHERLVLLRLLGMSESEYKHYWAAQVFRGDVDSEPLTVPSFGMVKEAATVFPGAIALVDARDVKPGMPLKVIKLDGHMPGDVGYSLR
jgi:hypothetical protein